MIPADPMDFTWTNNPEAPEPPAATPTLGHSELGAVGGLGYEVSHHACGPGSAFGYLALPAPVTA